MLRRTIFILALAVAGSASAGAQPNAAHDLAQRFSDQAATANVATDARATAQPEQPKAPVTTHHKPSVLAPAKDVATPSQSATARPTTKPAIAAPASKVAASERPSLDYEMDMLRRARAERADSKSADKPAAEPVVAKPAVAPPVTATPTVTPTVATKSETAAPIATPLTASPAKAVELAKPEPIAPTPQGAAPIKVEPPKIVEAPPTAPKTAATPTAAATAAAAAPPAPQPTAQASVLLAIETGGASSRAADATALDPIICVADTCFLSAGLSADAVKLSKADALKLKSSNDASPDACRGKVGCVFRNVGLTKDALIEVVEIGGATTEPGRSYAAEPDASCKTSDGALACENPIATADFRIWIVPEATAKTAGAEAIEEAVADSLPHRDIARDTDK